MGTSVESDLYLGFFFAAAPFFYSRWSPELHKKEFHREPDLFPMNPV